jgi:hypothetical protein
MSIFGQGPWTLLAILFLVSGGCARKPRKGPTLSVASAHSARSPSLSGSGESRDAGAAAVLDARSDASRPPSEGRVTLRLKQGGEIIFASTGHGEKTRVSLRGLPQADALQVGAIVHWPQKRVLLLMEAQRTYAELGLDEHGRVAGMLRRWRLEREGPDETVAGSRCSLWELTDGTYRVSACLASGPVLADVQTLRKALGVDLPAWAERVLEQGYLPLSISVQGADGQILLKHEAIERRDELVKAIDFEVPKDFRPVGGPKTLGRARRQPGAKSLSR